MLLVNGQARSGTTVLTRAIGSHPSVLSNMRESNYLDDVTRLLKNNLAKQNRLVDGSVALKAPQADFASGTLTLVATSRVVTAV